MPTNPTHRTARRALAALLAGGALAAAPAVASAQIPRIQQAAFTAVVTASQTTTWEREPLGSIADCTPVERFGGEGRETVVARLSGWRFTAHRVANQVSFVAAPGDAGLGATADVRVDRRGAERVEEVAGTCMGNPGRVTEAGPFDCGARNRPMNVQLLWRRGRLAVALADSGLAPLGRTTFESCPIHAHERVRDNGLTEISQALPAGDLFDAELKQHIVLARRTFRLDAGGYRGATTVRWQVKLTRRGAIR